LTAGDGNSQDELNAGIGGAVAGLIGTLFLLAVVVTTSYWLWQGYKRRLMRKKLAEATASVFNKSQNLEIL